MKCSYSHNYINMKDNDVPVKETVSPKTSGGISKTLLTPIRRLGLSRKWKKSGGAFVSPLAAKSVDSVEEVNEKTRKRRLCVDSENIISSPPVSEKNYDQTIVSTPTSTNDGSTPKHSISRKKSKIIASYDEENNTCSSEQNRDLVTLKENNENRLNISPRIKEIDEALVNKKSPTNVLNDKPQIIDKKDEECTDDVPIKQVKDDKLNVTINVSEQRVPNNLTKECIVVIQKNIQSMKVAKKCNTPSQVTHDSDSDDVPLIQIINKEESSKQEADDDHFATTKSNNSPRVHNLKKTESISSKKSTKSSKNKIQSEKVLVNKKVEVSSASQSSNSFEEDDDDFVVNKKTILVSKSYDKIAKPVKAKSTGSITQKDIDKLKAQIEIKKRHLFAKAMNKDTEELRGLIKKWQKGCQDALMELLELMKKKLPDRSDMDYSYILEMLKIPPALVGYDEENDCFTTPDDNNILAATFNDLQ